jgi:uncharacterized protein (TIGR03000 family)
MLASLVGILVCVDAAQAQTRRERRMERRDMRHGIYNNNYRPMNEMGMTSTPMAQTVVEASPTARISYYPTPVSEGSAEMAQIRVLLPDPQARIWFEGQATKQVGPDRLFYTPPLLATAANNYHIKITFMQQGQEVTRERVVSIMPGRTYVVDLTQR